MASINQDSKLIWEAYRDTFLTENIYIRDQNEWVTLYHELWQNFIDRAVSEASDDVKEKIKDLKPGYIITGPKEQVNFYEINEAPSPHVAFQTKHLSEAPGSDTVSSIHDYTIEDVKEWWEQSMKEHGQYKAGTLHTDPPDYADMWKHQDDQEDSKELVKRLKSAIEDFEPAEDVKWIYWKLGKLPDIHMWEIDQILQHYVESEHLTQQEVDMIKKEPGEPGDRG